jgi:membrane-bound lytic murein transglycosylase D
MKKLALYSAIIFLLGANLYLLTSTGTLNENSISYQRINPVLKNKAYSFAGELVPKDDPEVLERLDRELMSNVYWQGKTLQILKLSEKNFPIIEPILKEYGVPDDFKYLAVAESGLRDEVSPAGAVGKWQILKSTATSYGLIVNDEVDERYHLEKSTRAACKYLLQAYKQFGNWTSVAASYNMGMAGFQGKVNDQLESNYYQLWLNSETSRYVFRIIAFKEIFENPKAYGYLFQYGQDTYPAEETDDILLPIPTRDLALWAKDNQTNYKMLRTLNPWIRSSKLTTYPATEVVIRVPKLK